MNETYNRYASRKFLLALLVILLATTLAYLELLTPLLVDLFKWTCGLYFGFNVTQKGAEWIVTKLQDNSQ